MKSKVVTLLITGLSIITLLSACGDSSALSKLSRKELETAYITLNKQYTDLSKKYNDYKTLTAGIQSETDVTSAISITGDCTGRFTFNSVDAKIIFPSSFQYPNSSPTTGDGKVSIVSDVDITPGPNWICKINGSTLELENSDSGISGTIKVGSQQNELSPSDLKTQVLNAWFEGLPPAQVTYSEISVAGRSCGEQATTPTTIDSEDAFLRCGMIGTNNLAVTYIFVYRGNQDAAKDESVTQLLNTLEISGQATIVQQ